MRKILFDASSHLGQFSKNEGIRRACKNIHVQLAQGGLGAWLDTENGRVDQVIWSLDTEVQDAYYPFMDHFFTVAKVTQPQMGEGIENAAYQLKNQFPELSFYGRLGVAMAVKNQSQIHSLFAEIHQPQLISHLQQNGIGVLGIGSSEEEKYYPDSLELQYQTALKSFREHDIHLLDLIDPRGGFV